MALFKDREDAGRTLAGLLTSRNLEPDPIVLGLARGGVPVAFYVARELGIPFDAFVVRKLGVPYQPELAFGAIATGGARILNEQLVAAVGLSDQQIDEITAEQAEILERREQRYRGDRRGPHIAGRTVILVDDGVATGASLAVAIRAVRRSNPARVIGAVPVAPRRSCAKLARELDDLICVATPEPFVGVGAWYKNFDQVDDDQVRALLGVDRSRPSP